MRARDNAVMDLFVCVLIRSYHESEGQCSDVLVCLQIRSSMRVRDNAVMDLCVCLCADQEFHEK